MKEKDLRGLIVRPDQQLARKAKIKSLTRALQEAMAANPDEAGVGALQRKLIKTVAEILDHPDPRVRMQAVSYLTDRTEGPITRVAASLTAVREGVRLEILEVGGGVAPEEEREGALEEVSEVSGGPSEEADDDVGLDGEGLESSP